MIKKNKLWNIIRKNKDVDEELIKQYKAEKKEIKKSIEKCKKEFYQTKIENLQQKNKSIWEVVNEIVNKKTTKYR